MDRFLPAARQNFFNYLFTLTSLLAPVVVLVLLRDTPTPRCSGSRWPAGLPSSPARSWARGSWPSRCMT
jgi:hypothetical protein